MGGTRLLALDPAGDGRPVGRPAQFGGERCVVPRRHLLRPRGRSPFHKSPTTSRGCWPGCLPSFARTPMRSRPEPAWRSSLEKSVSACGGRPTARVGASAPRRREAGRSMRSCRRSSRCPRLRSSSYEPLREATISPAPSTSTCGGIRTWRLPSTSFATTIFSSPSNDVAPAARRRSMGLRHGF
jgi:hypothetical protein